MGFSEWVAYGTARGRIECPYHGISGTGQGLFSLLQKRIRVETGSVCGIRVCSGPAICAQGIDHPHVGGIQIEIEQGDIVFYAGWRG